MEKELKKLVIKSYHVKNVECGKTNRVTDSGEMTVDCSGIAAINDNPFIEKVDIDVISPGDYDRYTNAIMDFMPISAKVLGRTGEGITHTLTGVYVMLTGIDTDGNQISRFGSSYGILKEHVCFGRAGTPSTNDYIVSFNVALKAESSYKREAISEAFKVCDIFLQEFREDMKLFNGKKCTERHEYIEKTSGTKKKIAVFKQVPGQGAMFNTQILAEEPSGFLHGRSVIDLGNVPVVLTPNQYRDGALHAV